MLFEQRAALFSVTSIPDLVLLDKCLRDRIESSIIILAVFEKDSQQVFVDLPKEMLDSIKSPGFKSIFLAFKDPNRTFKDKDHKEVKNILYGLGSTLYSRISCVELLSDANHITIY